MTEDLAPLLRDIRDQQRQQLERAALSLQHQQEALALQRQQFDLYQQQLSRVERINDRAEAIQNRASKASKLVVWLALPLLLIAAAMLLWHGWR